MSDKSEVFEIPIGTSKSHQVKVTRELTVAHIAPGMPEVYATPMMIALMEIASATAIQPLLPRGSISVGTEVNVRHLAATPVGCTVTASAAVVAVNGRMVTFAVKAHDGVELIGEGMHSRAIVNLERFEARLKQRA